MYRHYYISDRMLLLLCIPIRVWQGFGREGLYFVAFIHCSKTLEKLKLPEFAEQRQELPFLPEFERWLKRKLSPETKNDFGLSDDFGLSYEDLHEESTGQRLTRFYFTM